MKKNITNSIGFGSSKSIKFGESLIYKGILLSILGSSMSLVGYAILQRQTYWFVGKTADQIKDIVTLKNSCVKL